MMCPRCGRQAYVKSAEIRTTTGVIIDYIRCEYACPYCGWNEGDDTR